MTRCTRCGDLPATPPEAALIETHEMCRRCRQDDLTERLDYLRVELRDLGNDLDQALGHVHINDDLEAAITALVAPLKAAT